MNRNDREKASTADTTFTPSPSSARRGRPWRRSTAAQLIEGFQAEYLLADQGYDTDAIILKAADKGMTPVIPSKKNRKELREYDKYLYKLRHLVENAFLLLKHWRGIATRYAKNVAFFTCFCGYSELFKWNF
ncbi:transposase [Oscillospiraceae bacterium 44-34]